MRALSVDGVKILSAERHQNKLKTGHLRGNRFVIRIRQLAVPVAEAAVRAQAILDVLAAPPGMPNFYGEQRFAPGNIERGRAAIRGDRLDAPPRERRMLISAFQSSLFNQWLVERWQDGLAARVIAGDILMKVSGASFATDDPAIDQPRVSSNDSSPPGRCSATRCARPPTGPRPPCASNGSSTPRVSPRLTSGAPASSPRGPAALAVRSSDPTVRVPEDDSDDSLEVAFSLPSGAYATVALSEIMKGS